ATPASSESSASGCVFTLGPDGGAPQLRRLETEADAEAEERALRLLRLRVGDDGIFVAGTYQHGGHGVTVEVHHLRDAVRSRVAAHTLEFASVRERAIGLALPGGAPVVALSRTESSSCGTDLDRVPRTLVLTGKRAPPSEGPPRAGRVAAVTALDADVVVAGSRGSLPSASYLAYGLDRAALVSRHNPRGALRWERELYAPGAEEFFRQLDERLAADGRDAVTSAEQRRVGQYTARALDVIADKLHVFVLASFGDTLVVQALAAEDGAPKWRAPLGAGSSGALDRVDQGGAVGISYVRERGDTFTLVARAVLDERGRELRAGSRRVEHGGGYGRLELVTTPSGHVWVARSREDDGAAHAGDAPTAWIVDMGPIVAASR
ncbi:MAG: hypothetical protein KC468_25370, partial [Myxococcales bacterium]|nr:hypothetical protein [Myxococcales bacterium]